MNVCAMVSLVFSVIGWSWMALCDRAGLVEAKCWAKNIWIRHGLYSGRLKRWLTVTLRGSLRRLQRTMSGELRKPRPLMSPRHQLARLRCLSPDWPESSVLRPLISNILLVARSAADLVRRPCTTLRPEPRPSSRLDLYLWAPRVPLFSDSCPTISAAAALVSHHRVRLD